MSQPLNRARRWRALAVTVGMTLTVSATALLSACGGSTRIDPYVPTRIMSFGDELSVINPDGSQYTVNATAGTTTTLGGACTVHPIWNLTLATNFGLAFAACQPITIASANGVMAAAAGARVDQVVAQVASARTTTPDAFVPKTLVTLQGGSWDVIDAYNTFIVNQPTPNTAAATQQVHAAALKLAALVNQVADAGRGPRVIFATIPDLGYSPLAFNGNATLGTCAGASDCRTLLSALSNEFNTTYRLNVIDDGHFAGLVTFDDRLRSMANLNFRTSVYGLINTDAATQQAACDATVLANLSTCTTDQLIPAAVLATGSALSAGTYLWAGTTLPGPAWHLQVGTLAVTRARNNPF
ncbi:MAG: hypothetical protein AB9M60_15420 [Leptothrix sp. (in: b-proteobacteria)]